MRGVKMNKSELVDLMASKSGLSKKDTQISLDAFMDSVIETLGKGDDISLIGFGTFTTTTRAAREGRNPSTGKPMQIAESKVAKFKVGAKLKEAVK
jgi:DNA-binding protein HU-beta